MSLSDHERYAGVKPCPPARFIPPFADQSGYHWIRRYRGAPCIPLYWNAEWHKNAGEGWGSGAEPSREFQWEYCGPCFSPEDTRPRGSDGVGQAR